MKLGYFEFRQTMATQGFSNHLMPSGIYHYLSRRKFLSTAEFSLEFCSDEEAPGLRPPYKNKYWVGLSKSTMHAGAWYHLDIFYLKQKLGDAIEILDKALSVCNSSSSMKDPAIRSAFNQFIASIQNND